MFYFTQTGIIILMFDVFAKKKARKTVSGQICGIIRECWGNLCHFGDFRPEILV